MELFVARDSIVRTVWGKSDTILFIFAGAAAEFALNKAVDWLYFTGKLPADPLGRLFSTVNYARGIVFAERSQALQTIDKINAIHKGVENARGAKIPDWAYRDVLFMLVHYSIAAYELLERKMSDEEKEELYNVFYKMGERMNIPGLPATYREWLPVREEHLNNDMANSLHTKDLFKQYRKHLGWFRYLLLVQGQGLVVPRQVKKLLGLHQTALMRIMLPMYKVSRLLRFDGLVKAAILPRQYSMEIKELDQYQ